MWKEKGRTEEVKRNPMYWLKRATNKHWKAKTAKQSDAQVIKFLKSKLANLNTH